MVVVLQAALGEGPVLPLVVVVVVYYADIAAEAGGQMLGERGLAAAGMTGNQDIADVVACVFHIGFSLISAARSILSVFVAYFTKIIPHSK